GPAGLAAAQQLSRAGHTVAVYERADRIGGLLRYGIPEFKMEKSHLDQRLDQLINEGVKFRAGVDVGIDITGEDLRRRYDAVVLAIGATKWRELPIAGRELRGVYQAMEVLPLANRVQEGDLTRSPLDMSGKHVVIIGGGDTGADCLGTAHRQGAASVTQLEIMPVPPAARPGTQPWPTYPMTYRTSSAHEEGGERLFAVATEAFLDDGSGQLAALRIVDVEMSDGAFQPVAGSTRELPADVVLLAMGFTGPEPGSVIAQLGLDLDDSGLVKRYPDYRTDVEGVYVCGDAGRGQSLIVWAIAEGRAGAASVDKYLTGTTNLPAPIAATARPLVV
ncbi:MAG: glutamate synthase subunit beta, partial [Actinomycetes bacterium]